MKKKLDTMGKRLMWALSELGVTPYSLSKDLDYKSPDSIYHILNDRQKVSLKFINRLKESDHGINPHWLLYGSGEPFLYNLKKGQYGNEYSKDGNILYPAKLDSYSLKLVLKRIAQTIFSNEDQEYSVKVKTCSIEGLDIIYTSYGCEDETMYPDKSYGIILQPDWRVATFFDFWRIESDTRRCQNLIEISDKFGTTPADQFESALSPLMNDLVELFDPEKRAFLNSHDYVEVYKTDNRM